MSVAFAPTFGAVGDIISVSILIKDLLLALNDSRGSSAEYQALTRELCVLDAALLQVEQLSRQQASVAELQSVASLAQRTVTECRGEIEAFTGKIKKYGKSLGACYSANRLKAATRKIQWLSEKEDVAKFRADMGMFTSTLNMLLVTSAMKLMQLNERNVSTRVEKTERRIMGLGGAILDFLMTLKQLGVTLTQSMFEVNSTVTSIRDEVMAIKIQASRLERPISEEFFMFEDAVGRQAPVHLRLIDSWEAFEWVLAVRFKDRRGASRVSHGRYALQERATSREITRSSEWSQAFLPGQVIDMSMLCKAQCTEALEELTACPKCGTSCEGSSDIEIQCPDCHIYFRRVIELLDDTSTNSEALGSSQQTNLADEKDGSVSRPASSTPSKRKPKIVSDLDESDDEDISAFTRIRLVAQRQHGISLDPKELTQPPVTRDRYGWTPLSCAASNGHLAIARLLLKARARVDSEDGIGGTPISYAICSGKEAVASLLRKEESGTDSVDNIIRTLLLSAAREGDEGVVQLLLATEKVDIDVKDNSGRTPLLWAAENGHEAVVQRLLDKGADVEARDDGGWTPLLSAAEKGHQAVVRRLLIHTPGS